jgi:hypothetical protein
MKKALLAFAIVAALFGCKKSSTTNVTPSVDVAHTTTFIIDTNTYWFHYCNAICKDVYVWKNPNSTWNYVMSSVISNSNNDWYKVGNYYRLDLPTTISGVDYYQLVMIAAHDTDWAFGDVSGDRMIKIINADTVYNSMK